MAGFHVGHAGRVELNDVVAAGDKSDGPGDGLLIDKRFYPFGNLGETS
jgi:hypothetical protein